MFRLGPDGMELVEIAPGVDLERDILARMVFKPVISERLRYMDGRLFRPAPVGLGPGIEKSM